jgi:hypothetical protein
MRRLLPILFLIFLVSPLLALNVSITTKFEGGNTPIVTGKTNLPDGTELIITISCKKSSYMAQDKVNVTGGSFSVGPFTQDGEALNPGIYAIEISSPNSQFQPQSVRDIIGREGNKLTGPYTRKSSFGGKVIAYQSTLKVGSGVSSEKDKASRIREKEDRHEWWIQSCKTNCDIARSAANKEGKSFNWDKCYKKCLKDEPK